MGSACCGGTSHSVPKEEVVNQEHFQEEDHHRDTSRQHKFKSVAFDVVVPVNSPGASPGTSGTFAAASTSFAAFDQTMYTMRGDASLSLGERTMNNNTFNFDTNMSFTNNFTDVNKDVVNMFLRNVKHIMEGGIKTNNMLEESVSMGASQGPLDLTNAPKVVGAGSNDMSPEDLEYINDGATLQEKLSRLGEVEEVLRQNIYGSWNMNSAIIQLAMLRVVPTLRQRRRPWKKPTTEGAEATSAAPASATTRNTAADKPAKRPVVVVHAQGLELDQSMISASAASQGGQETSSPAQADEALPGTTAKPAAPTSSPSPPPAVDPLNRSLSRTGFDPASAKVEHYEMLALTCRNIDMNDKVGTKVINDTWDFLSDDANTNALNDGECLFRFMCGSVANFDQETLDTMNLFINQSSFADEEKENNTPKINVYDPAEASKYICISVKAMYMLPGVKLANITPALVSSYDYQKHCQPSGNKLEDCDVASTFRLTITAIRFVLSFTVMFRVSEITDPNILFSFKSADGIVPAKVIMLERTKRNISKVDATAKVRSMLLYYPVNDGILCNSHTFVMNTSLPKAVAKIVNTFGSSGASQSAETAKLTRKYILSKFGDSRKK